MSFPEDATGTFEGRLGCPSELVLDRHVVGELSERSTGELRTHLAQCDVCRRRLEQRESGRISVPEMKRPAMLATIMARTSAPDLPVPEAAPAPAVPPPAPVTAAPTFLQRNGWIVLVPLFAALGAGLVWLLRRT